MSTPPDVPSTMRAVVAGADGSFTTTRVDVPRPAPGHDLVRVTRAAVNFLDAGLPAAIAETSERRVPGIVVAGVRCSDGARVVSLCGQGGYAEYVAAPSATTMAVPAGVDDDTALAVFVSGLTAWHLVHTLGRLRAGETVVVHSAAGSVGSVAVRLAALAGAGCVVATASSEAKRAQATALGATAVVDGRPGGLAERLLEAAGGRNIDLVLERDGGAVFDESLKALGNLGRIVVYGTSSGVRPVPTGALIPRSQTVSGFLLSTVMTPVHQPQQRFAELCALSASGELGPVTPTVRPLEAAAEVLADLVGRRTTGKVLLDPGA